MNGDLKKLLSSIDAVFLSRFGAEVIGALALMVFSFFFYRFGYLHNFRELSAIDEGIVSARNEITRIRQEAVSAEGLDRAVGEASENLRVLERRLKGLKEKLPSDKLVSRLLAEFSENGTAGLKVVSIKPLPPEDKGELSRLPFQITLESRFMPFGNYLERIENLPRLMVVDNFMIEPSEDGSNTLVSNIYLSAYILNNGQGRP